MTILEEIQALENKKKNRIADLLLERKTRQKETEERLAAIKAELQALGHKRQVTRKAEPVAPKAKGK